jgi:hypothetical protein
MVSSGMLKASQKRIKRVALSEASMSRQPASDLGWLAMMPMVRPLSRAKQTGCSWQSTGAARKIAVVHDGLDHRFMS